MDSKRDRLTEVLSAWPDPVGYVARTDNGDQTGVGWLACATSRNCTYWLLDSCLQVKDAGSLAQAVSRLPITAERKARTCIYPVYGDIAKMGYMALSPSGDLDDIPAELSEEMKYRSDLEHQRRARQRGSNLAPCAYFDLSEIEKDLFCIVLR